MCYYIQVKCITVNAMCAQQTYIYQPGRERVSQSQMFTHLLSRLIELLTECAAKSQATPENHRNGKENNVKKLISCTFSLTQTFLSLPVIKRIFLKLPRSVSSSPEKFDNLTILLFIKFGSLQLKK